MDMELVRDYVKRLSDAYQVYEVAYDPKYFTDTAKRLSDDGFTMVEFPRTGAVYDTTVTEFHRLVKNVGIAQDGDEVLASHIESTAAVQTEGSWKIFKLKQSRKIDACVSSIMSVGRCRLATENDGVRYAFR
jgi:phage terminase large subunit-like protein